MASAIARRAPAEVPARHRLSHVVAAHGLVLSCGWFVAFFVAAMAELAAPPWLPGLLRRIDAACPLGRPYALGAALLGFGPVLLPMLGALGAAELLASRAVERSRRWALHAVAGGWLVLAAGSLALVVRGWPAPELLVLAAFAHAGGAVALRSRAPGAG